MPHAHLLQFYFSCCRPACHLSRRWHSKAFIKLIVTEFGEEVYNGVNTPLSFEHELERDATELKQNRVNEEEIGRDDKASKRQKKQKDILCSPKKTTRKNEIELEQKNGKDAIEIVGTEAGSKRQKQSSRKSRKCFPKKTCKTAPKCNPYGHHKWTKEEDEIIIRAKKQHAKLKVVQSNTPLWSKLAKNFSLNPKQVYDRWVNKLDPKLIDTPMTCDDDFKLWLGYRVYEKEWYKISQDYFDGSRSGEHLRHRWNSPAFKKSINTLQSMDRFGHDILYRIALFVPSLPKLVSFCSASKQTNSILSDPHLSETLLRGLFVRRFCTAGSSIEEMAGCRWKERWIAMIAFKRSFDMVGDDDSQVRRCIAYPRTIGVLQPLQYEQSAILYDNAGYAQEHSHGYFGLHYLCNLSCPPNASDGWETPLILHGDFNGVKIFNSYDDVRHSSFLSLGDDEDQVLSFIASPSGIDLNHKDATDDVVTPCCFIGFASGKVGAIHAELSKDAVSYHFLITYWHAHRSEVTSLAFVHSMLVSACCGGEVFYYPCYGQAVQAFSNLDKCPIFSMASTKISSKGVFFNILFTGDSLGLVKLYLVDRENCTFTLIRSVKGGDHPVTASKILANELLVTGNTNGELRFWSFSVSSHYHEHGLLLPRFRFHLKRYLLGAHCGAVEMCISIGNILLTSGGEHHKLLPS